jgi:peptidoglycan/LPS O-acetylase OafA/YrhL
MIQQHTQKELVQIKKLHRYSYIDILRGIAILGVVAVHSGQSVNDLNIIVAWVFNYGQTGVQLFFVASAITLCLSSAQRNEKLSINFFIRRFFRIAPLFYLAILFYFLWRVCIEYYKFGVIVIPNNYSIHGVIETIFFVHGFDPRNFNFVVPGGWSIATEMTFYVIFPILFFLQKKYRKSKFIIFSVSIFFLCLLIKNFLIYDLQPVFIENGYIKKLVLEYDFLNTSILNQIIVFLIGIISYQYIYGEGKLSDYIKRTTPLAIPLIIVSCFMLNSQSYQRTPFTGLIYLAILGIAFALISIKLSTITEFTGRVSKLLIEVGKLSYSMYLIHFFIIDVVDLIFSKSINHYIQIPEIQLVIMYSAVLVLTFFISKLTYKHIEKKGIILGKNLIVKLNSKRVETIKPA